MPEDDPTPPGPPDARPLGTLALPDSWVSWAWELTRRRIEADATLRNAGFTVESFGSRRDLRDQSLCRPPILRFYPALGPIRDFDEGRQGVQLLVSVEAVLADLNPYDVLNLQCHLTRIVLATDDETRAWQQSLINQADAATGRWAWRAPLGQPLKDGDRKDARWTLAGLMSLDVLTPLVIL